jgi:hypothetical protein
MMPQKRDSRGRRLAVDITPLEAAEAESLRLEAEATGWIVTTEIEQRDGWRPHAYGWQFRLKVPIGEGWAWVHIPSWYDFIFWTRRDVTDAERRRLARQRISDYETAIAGEAA